MSHLFDKLYNTYSKVQDALTFNAATLSGAIDIVVVQHDDGLLTSTPFHVRFGKLQLLKSREKLVTIKVNGRECEFRMKLGHAGEAFFVFDADKQQPATEEELSSPITSPILAPAALVTTQGTITAINPIVNSGDKQHSDGAAGTSAPQSQLDEHRVPDLDLSHNTLSPPSHRATNRLSSPPRVTSSLAPTSSTSSHHVRYSSSPPVAIAPRRLLDDSDEKVAADSELERRQRVAADTNKLTEQQLQPSEAEAEQEAKASLHSHSAPMSPRTPEPTMRIADNDSPRSLPPFPRLRNTLSMDSSLLSPQSPLTPTSPTSPPDTDRMMSAPSATDARDHTYTWTWGTLPVHHQRNKPNDTARSEQVIHPASAASSVVTTPRANSLNPPSPTSLPAASSAASSSSTAAQPTNESAQLSLSATSPTIDSAPAGWSMRSIFSTVLSKLPYGGGGGGSNADHAALHAAAKEVDEALDVAEEKDETEQMEQGVAVATARNNTTSSISHTTAITPSTAPPTVPSSPSSLPGSINLAEAHLPVPWLMNVNSTADATRAPRPHNKAAELRVPSQNGLHAPLSAPLPSMSAPTAVPSAVSSPSSSASSDGAMSSTFALPSQARASSAVDRSLLQVGREREGQLVEALFPIAVDQSAISNGVDTATTISPSNASLPPSTASSPTSASTNPLSPQPAPPAPTDQTTLRLSLCGSYLGSSASLNQQLFDQHAVSFETLSLQPELTFRSDLVILYQSKLYPSRVALPLILSTLAFSRPLAITQAALDRLNTMTLPDSLSMDGGSGGEEEEIQTAKSTDSKVEHAVVSSPESGGRSWRDWFRSKKPPPIDTVTDGTSRTVLAATQATATDQQQQAETQKPPMRQSKSMENLSKLAEANTENTDTSTSITVQSPNLTSKPALQQLSLDPLAAPTAPSSAAASPKAARPMPTFIKSLRPTSDMLRSLKLQPGRNVVSFSVSSALQGEQTMSASIFLWKPDVKIVISDIDGTITRSDILGHVMPLVGRDWSHLGVTQLYSDISRNGYQLLYLTSRAIGQANITRGYISSLKQGESRLPLGPVIMSPDRLLHSFKREVIDRRPQEFKIIALRDIRGLFDDDYCPFYAGFGNRITDVVAYRAVGVPQSRIYIINPHSVIQHINQHYSKSYVELTSLVHHMFPSLLDGHKGETEFNDTNYWRQPLPALSDDEDSETGEDSSEEDDDEVGLVKVGQAGEDEDEDEELSVATMNKMGLSQSDRKEAEREEKEISKDKVVYKV